MKNIQLNMFLLLCFFHFTNFSFFLISGFRKSQLQSDQEMRLNWSAQTKANMLLSACKQPLQRTHEANYKIGRNKLNNWDDGEKKNTVRWKLNVWTGPKGSYAATETPRQSTKNREKGKCTFVVLYNDYSRTEQQKVDTEGIHFSF